MRRQFRKRAVNVIRVVACVMRVYAGRCTKLSWPCFGKSDCVPAALFAAARQDHATHAGVTGALDDLVAIVIETVVRQVRAYVNQIDWHQDNLVGVPAKGQRPE